MSYSRLVRVGLISFFLGVGLGDFVNLLGIFVILVVFLVGFFFLWRFINLENRKYLLFFCVGSIAFLFGLIRILLTVPDFGIGDTGFYREMPGKVVIEGQIAGEPDLRNDAQYVVINSRIIRYKERKIPVSGKILVKLRPYPQFEYGDELEINGSLKMPAEFDSFSYADYLAKDSIFAVMYSPKVKLINRSVPINLWSFVYWLKGITRARIEELFAAPGDSLVLGLLIGARATIPQQILDNFQMVGLTHILAISGYNITLIINIFGLAFKSRGRKFRFWATFGAIAFFAMLTGLSASVVRASVMGGLVVFALFQGRKSDGMQMLLLSGFLMVLVNPLILLGDVSFQLSFLSTLGLLVLLPLWEESLKKLPVIISESLSVTLAATVFTTPIVLYNFGRFSLISPLANIIFLPLIPLIMLTSFFALVISVLFFPIAMLIVGICSIFIFLLIEGVALIAEVPFALIDIPFFSEWMMVFYYLILWWVVNFFRKSKLERAS